MGFWNADEGNDVIGGKARVGGEDGVYHYRPHMQSVSSLYIPPHTPEVLWSTSYDGTMRRMDIEREAFVEAYRIPEELGEDSFHDAAFSDGGVVAFLGCRSGEVIAMDVRSGQMQWRAQAHNGKLTCGGGRSGEEERSGDMISCNTTSTAVLSIVSIHAFSLSSFPSHFSLSCDVLYRNAPSSSIRSALWPLAPMQPR